MPLVKAEVKSVDVMPEPVPEKVSDPDCGPVDPSTGHYVSMIKTGEVHCRSLGNTEVKPVTVVGREV